MASKETSEFTKRTAIARQALPIGGNDRSLQQARIRKCLAPQVTRQYLVFPRHRERFTIGLCIASTSEERHTANISKT